MTSLLRFVTLLTTTMLLPSAAFGDWPRFLGTEGKGISAEPAVTHWSETENLLWKVDLAGMGASSPIIVGEKLFLTASEGKAEALQRYVLCYNATTGEKLWTTKVDSVLPEQERIREEHGYASSTPIANAERLFVFFGKSGVFCFDHQGKQQWNTQVGDGLNGWGSAASLTLHEGKVLVNASVESEALVALDQATGKEIWRTTGLKESWHAPVVTVKGQESEVIMGLINEVKGYDLNSGKEKWRCKSGITWYMCPQPLVDGEVAYFVGGRSGTGGLAVKLGGTGDVTASHRLWTLEKGTNVPSPLLHQGHLYFIHENKAIAHCVEAKTGDFVYSKELDPNPGQVYASPVMAADKIYYLGRGGKMVIIQASPEFKVLGNATLENGRGVFNATPAIDRGRLYIRSNKALYCLGGNQ